MRDETVSIARVPLARAPRRLLLAPALAALVGAAAFGLGRLLGGWGGLGLGVAGIVTIALAGWLVITLLSIGLEVEVAAIRIHWIGGEQRHLLARGPVTRVALQGPGAVRLRARFGFVGWALGRGTLRGEERIQVVRLAPSATLILVPTIHGRLAVAPASEGELLAALAGAARVQQRLDAVAARTPSLPPRPEPPAQAPVAPAVPEVSVEAPAHAAEPLPRALTGIERVELEARLAAQRAAALAAAEAERQAQELAGRAAAAPIAPGAALTPRRARVRAAWHRPAWLDISRGGVAAVAVLLLPLLGSAAAWLVASLNGQAHGDAARGLVLAIALAGPAATLGAIGARLWWPRLIPLVVASSLFALVLIGRVLAG